MVDFFIKYLKNQKRVSDHTVTAYQTDLDQLKDFLNDIPIEQADFQDLRSWIVSLSESGLSNTSINRKIAGTKAFFKYLLSQKKIEKNPAILLKNLKTPKRNPVFLDENATTNLLDEIEYNEDFKGIRDKLILEVLYGTGIRLSELVNLKESDLDLSVGRIKVLGKRSKYRFIPLHNNLISLFKKYLEIKKEEAPVKTDNLLVTDKFQPIYPVFVQRKVKQFISKVSTQKKQSPHVLRHTFATHLLNHGADLVAIKELLGHANLSATQIYTHNSISKLKEAFEKAHPKA